jgi:glycosyltransferase involved in cell wall biosynthesis
MVHPIPPVLLYACGSDANRIRSSRPMPLLSILVPVYNEARTVAEVLERLAVIALPCEREVVVIDDGSSDGTYEVLERYRDVAPFRILHAAKNGGKGSAIRLGLAQARGEIIAIQDADLELDPAQIAALVEPILAGETDVVFGSRFLEKTSTAPLKTVLANRFLTLVTNVLFGAAITDMETCYKVMRTTTARSLDLQASRFDIEPEITATLLKRGHRIVERPVRFEPRSRAAGKKIGWKDGVAAIGELVKHRVRS